MVAAHIRSMARPHWLALYGGIVVAWGALYVMALPADLREAGAIYGAEFLRSLCVVSPDAAGFFGLVAMWLLMSAAMMAPTALPAFATYDELGRRAETRFGALVGGYLAVWGGFSVLAAALQMALTQAGALTIFGDSRSLLLSGGLLILAGLYQFSALKEACLSKCRAPLTFFMAALGRGGLSQRPAPGGGVPGLLLGADAARLRGGRDEPGLHGARDARHGAGETDLDRRGDHAPSGGIADRGGHRDPGRRDRLREERHGREEKTRRRPATGKPAHRQSRGKPQAPPDAPDRLGDQGGAVSQLQLHRVLPLRREPREAPADRGQLQGLDGDRHRRGALRGRKPDGPERGPDGRDPGSHGRRRLEGRGLYRRARQREGL
jgi:hypothetical protein